MNIFLLLLPLYHNQYRFQYPFYYLLFISLSTYNYIVEVICMKFVPRRGDKEVISFRIPKDLLNEIDKLANNNALSRNEFMVQCLEFAIDNISDENEE